MKTTTTTLDHELDLDERLARSGFRLTPQRRRVYEVLVENRDHPTAEEVFIRVKQRMPEISMATVYNCLEALVECHLVRQVNLERAATRYCSNLKEHGHFYCSVCGRVFDVDCAEALKPRRINVPQGFQTAHAEISIRGVCPDCVKHQAEPAATDTVSRERMKI